MQSRRNGSNHNRVVQEEITQGLKIGHFPCTVQHSGRQPLRLEHVRGGESRLKWAANVGHAPAHNTQDETEECKISR